ncbi:MAG: DUF262 domain-containing protein [Lachnospiraceae bacterium]|nr:DUF262 domain-containing protein [Lachnospiraceae bacterium]
MLQSEPGHLTFEQLKNKINEGNIKIPQFQREFVWKKEDAAKLLDSVVKGFPIGSFILWETKSRLRSIKNIGGIALPNASDGEVLYYVLDGQQRITSIYASMLGVKIEKEDYSQIYIDLLADSSQDIVILDLEGRKQDEIISINELLRGKMSDIFAKYGHNQETLDKIDMYKTRFTTYQFPTIKISDAELDVATDIFTRINVGGKGLDTFEIMCAKTYDESQGFDLYERRKQQKEEWSECGYETIPHSTVLQAISICLNGGCSRKDILNKIEKQDFINIWEDIDKNFKQAIDYLKSALGIAVSKLLPYDGLIVPYVYYFHKHPQNPSAIENQYLKDYFWRCVLTNRFSNALESKLAQDVTHVMDAIIEQKQPKYEQGIDITYEFLKRNGGFSTGNALIKGLLCLLAKQNPKSFKNGIPVVIDNSWLSQGNSKNYHHFFPKNYMKKNQPLIEDALVNHIANITIVDSYLNKGEIKDRAPSDYMKQYYKDNGSICDIMNTHLIGDLKEFGIWDDNYSAFFDKRLKAIIIELKQEIVLTSMDIVDAI